MKIKKHTFLFLNKKVISVIIKVSSIRTPKLRQGRPERTETNQMHIKRQVT